MPNNYVDQLRLKMDQYVHFVYAVSKVFPKDELYEAISQLRRAALSVALNFTEGYARRTRAAKRNFWEISFGSLKESIYLVYFSLMEKYLSQEDYDKANQLAEEIGAMLWRVLQPLADNA